MKKDLSIRYLSLEDLYDDNFKLVYYYLKKYLNNYAFIDDINSDVWLKIIDKGDKLLAMSKYAVKAYLKVTVRNTVIDYSRKENSSTESIESIDKLTYSLIDKSGFSKGIDDSHYVEDILKSLSIEEKAIIYYRYKEELSFKEISSLLCLNENTARSKHNRALIKLRIYAENINEEVDDEQ